MGWHKYENRISLDDIGKIEKPEDLTKAEGKQFARARRLAKQIAESGEVGPKSGTFDVSIAGHAPEEGEDLGLGRARGVTISIAEDQVS